MPTDTLRISFFDDGAPAVAVPQYWHRADGFEDMFIAHAESRQRVRFAREHAVAPCATVPMNNTGKIYNICGFISSLRVNYNKNATFMQREKPKRKKYLCY